MAVKRPPDQQSFHYEGFSSPNGTIVPDDLFDLLAPRLTEAELRVLLYIIRRTFGFGKNADAISLRQLTEGITTRDGRILDYGTGMSRKAVITGTQGLAQKGIINIEKRLDERGQNQVNIYTLRFREGVVTKSNYGGYPSTLPIVTEGNPQESVLQESVGQLQQPRLPGSAGSGVAGEVVVAYNDPAYGRPELYEALRDLGIHHHTASKLLREYDHDEIEQMLDFVTKRLQRGWTPQESPAAFVVAAIRGHYELPASYKSKAAVAEDQAKAQEQWTLQIEADRAENGRVEEELRRQREAKLLALGLEQYVDKLWQQAQGLLRERGQWSVAMSMCFLKSIEMGEGASPASSGLAILLVPSTVRRRLAAHEEALRSSLEEVSGRRLQLIMHEIRT